MPLAMAVFAFASIVVTSSAAHILNTSSNLITDPMVVTSLLSTFQLGENSKRFGRGWYIDSNTLGTNIAANILAPANAIQNLAPSKLSFRTSAILSMILGTLCLLETHQRRELVHIRVVDWIRRVPRSDFRNHALRLLPHT